MSFVIGCRPLPGLSARKAQLSNTYPKSIREYIITDIIKPRNPTICKSSGFFNCQTIAESVNNSYSLVLAPISFNCFLRSYII